MSGNVSNKFHGETIKELNCQMKFVPENTLDENNQCWYNLFEILILETSLGTK